MTDPALCELRGIQLRFPKGKGQIQRVLEDIHLKVAENEIIAIIGPNDAGKSSLLRVIAGLTQPTQGEVRVCGEILDGLNLSASMVFQTFALFPWMNVEENVRVVLRSRDLPEEEVRARAQEAIQRVGIEGFEEAFPRELSRGTKQRVGIARALAVDPELLIMDEPFSQVDALTAEALRAELLDIWMDPRKNPHSIVMVSHSIREALLVADRVVIMDGPPGTIRAIVDVPLSRPRNTQSRDFMTLVEKVHDIIANTELPDVQADLIPGTQEEDLVEPLPPVNSADILGLLEFLDAQGGSGDIFSVAQTTQVPFQQMILTVKAAEMLEFVDTPRRIVMLDDLGRRFVAAGMDERKDIWREQLLKMRLFRVVNDMLELKDGELSREELLQEFATRLPTEIPEITFDTVIAWGRFGELFAYREDKEVLTHE